MSDLFNAPKSISNLSPDKGESEKETADVFTIWLFPLFTREREIEAQMEYAFKIDSNVKRESKADRGVKPYQIFGRNKSTLQ